MALLVGVWAAVLAAFVGVAAALFPFRPALTRAWEMLVVGVDATGVAALPVGIVEAFVGGWVAGWVGLWAARLLGAARRTGPRPRGARRDVHLHYWLGALEQHANRPRRLQ